MKSTLLKRVIHINLLLMWVLLLGMFFAKTEIQIEGANGWATSFFWISEDFLWFVFNPAFGLARFSSSNVPWHKHWFLGVPTDYVTYMLLGALLLVWSFLGAKSKNRYNS